MSGNSRRFEQDDDDIVCINGEVMRNEKEKNSVLKKVNTQLEIKISEQQAMIEEQQEKIDEMTEDQKMNNQREHNRGCEFRKIQLTCADLRNQLEEYQNLEPIIAAMKSEGAKLQDIIEHNEADRRALSTRVELLKNTIQELKTANSNCYREKKRYDERIESLKRKAETYERENFDLKNKYKEMQQENGVLNKQIEELNRRIVQKENELKNELEAYAIKNISLFEQIDELKAENEKLKAEKEGLANGLERNDQRTIDLQPQDQRQTPTAQAMPSPKHISDIILRSKKRPAAQLAKPTVTPGVQNENYIMTRKRKLVNSVYKQFGKPTKKGAKSQKSAHAIGESAGPVSLQTRETPDGQNK